MQIPYLENPSLVVAAMVDVLKCDMFQLGHLYHLKHFCIVQSNCRWPFVWETAVHLAVAGGVFYGVFCAVLFPAGCLGWDLWDLIESVSGGFPSYSHSIVSMFVVNSIGNHSCFIAVVVRMYFRGNEEINMQQ